jgi:hypothetical protein
MPVLVRLDHLGQWNNAGVGGVMNNRSRITANMNNLLKVIGLIAFLPLIAGPAWAQSSSKAKGEVVSASQAKINGFSAISGMTVFSNNRVMTGQHGSAVINLGKLGRIEFGAETDMTLRLTEASIGGELRSNRVVVSARAGIAIAVNTAKSIVTTDGRQPAVLTIYVDGESARVIAHVGEASVVPTGKDGRMAGGKDLSKSPRGAGWKRAGLVAGAVGAAGAASAAKIGVQGAAAAPNASTFAGLFKAGIDYSIDPKFNNRGQDSEDSFETSMTCRDSDKKYCRKKSWYKPQRP